ncbi:AAA family ATPase [Labrys neptuniae]
MQRILITGMSGTGKSSVIHELRARGHQAYDLDTPEWSHWVAADPSDGLTPGRDEDWVWQVDKVRALLSKPASATVFVSGCAENMSELYPLIDTIILLSAPVELVMARLTARSTSAYGHSEEERRKVAALLASVEPLLREAADIEIDTSGPFSATVDVILRRI